MSVQQSYQGFWKKATNKFIKTYEEKMKDIFIATVPDAASDHIPVFNSKGQLVDSKKILANFVQTTRRVNNKALSADITLNASDIGAATQKSYTVRIGTAWSGSAAPYTQTITVSGILSTDDPIVDLITTINNYAKEIEEYGKIFKITTAANKITVYATDKTTISISCKLKVVR